MTATPGSAARRLVLLRVAPAIADHGAFAGSQLAIHVLCARWMTAHGYGELALAWALLVIVAAGHAALLSDPLLVFARRRSERRLPHYWGALLVGHVGITGASSALCCVIALAVWYTGASPALAACAAVTLPAQLSFSLLRRLCHSRDRFWRAAAGSAAYACVALVAVAALHERGQLDAPSALLACALSSAVGASILWLAAGVRARRPGRRGAMAVARAHWRYGRFAALSALATWLPWNLLLWLCAPLLGLAGVGHLRALYNVQLPLAHALTPVFVVALGMLADAQHAGRMADARVLASRMRGIAIGLGAAYAAFWFVWGDALMTRAYGGAYEQVYGLARWVALAQVPLGVVACAALVSRATGRTDRALCAWLPYVAASLVLGGAGLLWAGTPGAVVGMLAAAWLGAGVTIWYARNRTSPSGGVPAHASALARDLAPTSWSRT